MHLELSPAVARRLALLYLSSGALRGVLSGPGRRRQLLGRFAGVPRAGLMIDQRIKHVRVSEKVATRAPELVLGKELFGVQLDVWGLGIVLFGMVFGYAPFGNEPQDAEAFDQR